MDFKEAETIIRNLAQGIDPTTGELYGDDSPYNEPRVIRALFTVHDLARQARRPKMSIDERRQENIDRGRPGNAGLPWTDGDRDLVGSGFQNGKTVEELAATIERTLGAVRAELIRQGLLSPDFS